MTGVQTCALPISIEVAQSGHAVWATIHASDAFGILTRLEVMLRGHMAEPIGPSAIRQCFPASSISG